MNPYEGSIQTKNGNHYLVVRQDGKQRWLALCTKDVKTAHLRAAEIAPQKGDETIKWLSALVRLGRRADNELKKRNLARQLSWDGLWRLYAERTCRRIPDASRPSYTRWLAILAETASALGPERPSPIALTHDDARRISSILHSRYISARRMTGFFAHVWKTLGLDGSVWTAAQDDFRPARGECSGTHRREYYRRLTLNEVRAVFAFLSQNGKRDHASMVALGFYTGLRLSDVAELELSEISPGGRFLVLQPNKVRHSKARLLTIPLVEQARAIVLSAIARKGIGEFLFPPAARKRPSKTICAAFRACGVLRKGDGRASFHSLRATFISMMDEAGISPHMTDAITGHAGGGMHARYSQPTPAALSSAIRRAFPPSLRLSGADC